MHRIAILLLPTVAPLDLGIVSGILGEACASDGERLYELTLCAEAADVGVGAFSVRVERGIDLLRQVDTIVIPGIHDLDQPVSDQIRTALRDAAARDVRIATVCSGAFILAATGLLDGLRVATHWKAAPLLAARFPRVIVDPDVLYVDNDRFVTSAGASAGIDMCLHLIARDHGHAVAAHCSRMSVSPLHRSGGQAQFSLYEAPASPSSLAPLLDWLQSHTASPITLDELVDRAGMSCRTFHRRFREQTGTSPLQWLILARVRAAQALLETTDLSIDAIALRAGFESPELMRHRFQRVLGVSPRDYRRSFADGALLPPDAKSRRTIRRTRAPRVKPFQESRPAFVA